MKFSRQNLPALRDEIMTALGAVEANNPGLKLRLGKITFLDTSFSCKLEASVLETGADGTVVDVTAQNDWKLYASAFGLRPEDFGKEFIAHGHRFTVAGIKPKSFRFPILCKRSDGKMFKYPAETVVRLTSRV